MQPAHTTLFESSKEIEPINHLANLTETDRKQLDRLLRLMHRVLKANALGAYLYGSAVQGGLRHESDLDVMLVVQRPTAPAEKQRLVERLLAISGRRGRGGRWRYVELTIVVASAVKPWRYPPAFDFQYGDWLRSEFEAGNLAPWPETVNPDLALLIFMVLLADAPLFGPPPAALLDPVPQSDLRRAMLGSLDSLLADLPGDTRNVILTLARMWTTLATGAILSKDAAADWALEHAPAQHQPVLRRAREYYLTSQPEVWDDLSAEVSAFAAYGAAEIRRLAGG